MFVFFFNPGETPPAAAGMDGRHGWVVVKFRLLPPLRAVPSQGFGICGDLPVSPPPAPGGDTRQEKEAAVARCEEAEREGFGEGWPRPRSTLGWPAVSQLLQRSLPTWISFRNGREGPEAPMKGPAPTHQAAPGVHWSLPGHSSEDPTNCPTSPGWGLCPRHSVTPRGQRVRTILSWMVGDAGKWYGYTPAGTGRLSPR